MMRAAGPVGGSHRGWARPSDGSGAKDMDINFGCTQCGNCCHDLKLPLSVEEASSWLERGDEVQILCEAIPWPGEPTADDLQAAYKRKRSFEVRSGSMPARVIVTLAAPLRGPCPNLRAGMQCGIYEDRPRVCRIYPAEVNPFTPLVPSNKGCPPEAWGATQAPLIRGGVLVDDITRTLIAESVRESLGDVANKESLCADLGIRSAAMSNEGFVVHSPDRRVLLEALSRLDGGRQSDRMDLRQWQFVSSRPETLSAFAEIGADAVAPAVADVEYIDLRAAA